MNNAENLTMSSNFGQENIGRKGSWGGDSACSKGGAGAAATIDGVEEAGYEQLSGSRQACCSPKCCRYQCRKTPCPVPQRTWLPVEVSPAVLVMALWDVVCVCVILCVSVVMLFMMCIIHSWMYYWHVIGIFSMIYTLRLHTELFVT